MSLLTRVFEPTTGMLAAAALFTPSAPAWMSMGTKIAPSYFWVTIVSNWLFWVSAS